MRRLIVGLSFLLGSTGLLLHCSSFNGTDANNGTDGAATADSGDAALGDGGAAGHDDGASAQVDGGDAALSCKGVTATATLVYGLSFDDGVFPPSGTGTVLSGTGSVATKAPSDASAPWGFLTVTDASLGVAQLVGSAPFARIPADAGPCTRIRLQAMIQPGVRTFQSGELSLLRIGTPGDPHPPHFYVHLDPGGVGGAMDLQLGPAGLGDAGAVCSLSATFVEGQWIPLDLVYTLGTREVTLHLGGASCSGTAPEFLTTTGPYDLQIALGLDYVQSGFGPIVVDDYSVSLE
jgi:hypothetical protein